MPSFHILVNPKAAVRNPGLADLLRSRLAPAGRLARLQVLPAGRALGPAVQAAAERAAREGGVLVAAGGDGTINTVAQAAWARGCALGLVPLGTFNYFARTHGIPLDCAQAAEALLGARLAEVQVGEVADRLFLVNVSLGLHPQWLQDRESLQAKVGRHRWVATATALGTLLRWRRPLVMDLRADGEPMRLRTPTLIVGNNALQLQRLGLPGDVVERVGRGRLAALAVAPLGPLALVGLLVRGALGQLGDAHSVESFAFGELALAMPSVRQARVAIDGEVGRLPLPLRLRVSPRPLRLMVPAQPQPAA